MTYDELFAYANHIHSIECSMITYRSATDDPATRSAFLTGRPFPALLNLGLTMPLRVTGAVHAILVVNEPKADERAYHVVDKLTRSQN